MITWWEVLGGIVSGLTIIGLLVRIAWSLGQLVQKFGDHVTSADKIHGDQETRIRNLEGRTRRIRLGAAPRRESGA